MLLEYPLTKPFCDGGIVLKSEITSPKTDEKDLTGEITSPIPTTSVSPFQYEPINLSPNENTLPTNKRTTTS